MRAIAAAEGGDLDRAVCGLSEVIAAVPGYASAYNNRAQVRVHTAVTPLYGHLLLLCVDSWQHSVCICRRTGCKGKQTRDWPTWTAQ
jgi:hypothetical protein